MTLTSGAGAWYWDGAGWRSYAGARGEWWWDGRRWRDRRALPGCLRVARRTVFIQGYVTAGLAAVAVLLAGISLIIGAWVFAITTFGVAIVVAGVALGAVRLGGSVATSAAVRWAVSALELLVFLPGGVAMTVAAGVAQSDAGATSGTDGPFADGGVGAIALAGYAYAGGAVAVLIALGCVVGRRLLRPAIAAVGH